LFKPMVDGLLFFRVSLIYDLRSHSSAAFAYARARSIEPIATVSRIFLITISLSVRRPRAFEFDFLIDFE